MAIGISQPLHREGGFAIDDSLLLTKAQMKNMPDSSMPSRYFCICLEDGKIYLYDKSATPDAETGKYFLYSNESVSPFVELAALPEANEEAYNQYKGMLVFVPSSEPTADNKFDEYKIYQDSSTTPATYYWDKVGDFKPEIDLSEYVKHTEVLREVIASDNPVSGSAVLAELNKKQNVITARDGVKKIGDTVSADENWFQEEVPTEEKGDLLVSDSGAPGVQIPISPDLFVPYPYIIGESSNGDRLVLRCSSDERDLSKVATVAYQPLILAQSGGPDEAYMFINLPGEWQIYGTATQPRVQGWLDLSKYAKKEELENKADKDNTYTKSEVDNLIPDVSDLATKTEVADGLAGKADKSEIPDVTPLATKTEVAEGLAGKADKTEIPDTSGLATKTELNEGLANKQDTLQSGTNIKTVNRKSILGEGDIETTPTLDEVLKKGNTSKETANVGGVEVKHEDSGNSSELYAAGLSFTYNYEGQENRRMAHIDYESVGFSHLERNTSPSGGYNIVPDFVISARNGQVEMNEAIKEAFKEKLGITNEVFIAKQDTTSAAELIAAYEANQAILIVPSGTVFTSWRWVSIGLDRKSATKCEVLAIFNNGSNLNNGLTLVKFTVDGTTWTYASQVVQNKLVSGTNIKTVNGESLLGEGNIEVSSGGGADFSIDKDDDTGTLGKGNDYFGVDMSQDDSVRLSLTKPGEYAKNKVLPTKEYVDRLRGIFVLDTANPCSYNDLQAAINAPKVVFIKHMGVFYPLVEKWENDEGAKRYVNIASMQRQGADKGVIYFFFEAVIADLESPMAYSSTFVQPTGKPYTDSVVGSLSALNTDNKDNIVTALNEVYEKSGEPFRVKQWATNSLNVTIPTCTSDIGNTSIAKMIFTIDSVEGADYQIVGIFAYEVFDAASGGNRINCWPVCQFTGNGQKELSVRWMCGGTTDKVAKRINAWVLLKHR